VNPLLRAAYLAKDKPDGKVHLLIPWVTVECQKLIFPNGIRFKTPEEQRAYLKAWLVNDALLPLAADKLDISFYAGRFMRHTYIHTYTRRPSHPFVTLL
jgi:hypothetical protein